MLPLLDVMQWSLIRCPPRLRLNSLGSRGVNLGRRPRSPATTRLASGVVVPTPLAAATPAGRSGLPGGSSSRHAEVPAEPGWVLPVLPHGRSDRTGSSLSVDGSIPDGTHGRLFRRAIHDRRTVSDRGYVGAQHQGTSGTETARSAGSPPARG